MSPNTACYRPYLSSISPFTFTGPVARYAGIGRFVMGLIDEIEIVEPEEFKEYVKKKIVRK